MSITEYSDILHKMLDLQDAQCLKDVSKNKIIKTQLFEYSVTQSTDKFDLNGDKRINYSEIFETKDEHVYNFLFNDNTQKYDMNNDGIISFEEFKKAEDKTLFIKDETSKSKITNADIDEFIKNYEQKRAEYFKLEKMKDNIELL